MPFYSCFIYDLNNYHKLSYHHHNLYHYDDKTEKQTNKMKKKKFVNLVLYQID